MISKLRHVYLQLAQYCQRILLEDLVKMRSMEKAVAGDGSKRDGWKEASKSV